MRKQPPPGACHFHEAQGKKSQTTQMHLLLFGGGVCQVCSHSIIQRQAHDQVQSHWGMPENQDKLGEEMNDYEQIDVK